MFNHILVAKIHIASPAANLVPRSRLLERLEQAQQRRLTLVAAPAGSGKTTLIQQWLAQSKLAAAWVSLDEDDNDLQRFLSYLIAALWTIDASLGDTTASLLQAPQIPPLRDLIAPLISDLSTITEPFVIVLDDYHFISNLEIHNALIFLLDNAPPMLHLVIASREDPPIPVQRLRVSRQLVEIRAADLRFTGYEAQLFFEQTMSLHFDEGTVAKLEARTEGWIAGLQMAALSMRDIPDVAGFVEAFTGDHRYVADYLIAEVLNRQLSHVREFLLTTSILNRFTPPLCDVLIEVSPLPSHEMIKKIEKLGLFLIPLDHKREWYRYHQMFADLLRHRLRRDNPERFFVLCKQASRWFLEQGHTDEAIHYALIGEDYDMVANLLEEIGLNLIGRSQIPRLRQWIEALPESLIEKHPYLSILLTWIGALTGDLKLAGVQLTAAEENLSWAGDKIQAEIMSHLALLRAYAARSRGDLDISIQRSQEALNHMPENNHFLDCTIRLNLGGNYWLKGDFGDAEAPLEHAITFISIPEVEYPALAAAGFLANTYIQQGRLREAKTLCKQMIEYKRTCPHPALAYVYLEQGELFYEYNKLEDAREHLLSAIQLGELTDRVVNVVRARLVLAQVYLALGSQEEAAPLIEQAADLYNQSSPRYQTMHQIEYDYYRLRCLLYQQNLSPALRWAQDHAIQNKLSTPWSVLTELIYARILLIEGQPEEALVGLTQCEESARSVGASGWVIQSLTLQALCHQATSDLESALDVLCQAVALAEPEGYVRTFVDPGQPMTDLLALLLTQIKDCPDPRFTAGYVGNLLKTMKSANENRLPLAEPLTDRELDVLRLLAAGFSNQEIADQLVISLGTVKQYNHVIYRKLDVSTRHEAAEHARKLNLL